MIFRGDSTSLHGMLVRESRRYLRRTVPTPTTADL
jgi:hypothetical protein